MLNNRKLLDRIDFADKTVIEFGPLEGGNTILLEKLGAKRILAVEGQLENFIKCCVIKVLFGLDRSTFVLDNVKSVTRDKYGTYDVAFVAGVLYHLDEPHLVLRELGNVADRLVLSTHYADDESPSRNAEIKEIRHDGTRYRGRLFGEGLGPCAGLQSDSFWPYKDDLLKMVQDAGYTDIEVVRDSTDAKTKYKLIYLIAAST
jgi:hypothetical protein